MFAGEIERLGTMRPRLQKQDPARPVSYCLLPRAGNIDVPAVPQHGCAYSLPTRSLSANSHYYTSNSRITDTGAVGTVLSMGVIISQSQINYTSKVSLVI